MLTFFISMWNRLTTLDVFGNIDHNYYSTTPRLFIVKKQSKNVIVQKQSNSALDSDVLPSSDVLPGNVQKQINKALDVERQSKNVTVPKQSNKALDSNVIPSSDVLPDNIQKQANIALDADMIKITEARHHDPFSVLGRHINNN